MTTITTPKIIRHGDHQPSGGETVHDATVAVPDHPQTVRTDDYQTSGASAHGDIVVGPDSTLPDPAKHEPRPTEGTPGRDQISDEGQIMLDAQARPALVGSTSGHRRYETQESDASSGSTTRTGSRATDAAKPIDQPLADPVLALLADVLDDAEETRKANVNRLAHMTRSAADSDGEVRGLGLTESDPGVAGLRVLVDHLGAVEKEATRLLEKRLRAHPLGPWVKAQRGVGDKQAARLLAVLGDPYLRFDHEDETWKPRTVSQLWAYCGHGDPVRKRRKGMTQAEAFALGSPTAKMRLHLIAESCIKQVAPKTGVADANAETEPMSCSRQSSPYRLVYDRRRAQTTDRLHAASCTRCGPSGHPAAVGTPWSAAHQHADALRVVGKAILRDLWLEAKRLHETAP